MRLLILTLTAACLLAGAYLQGGGTGLLRKEDIPKAIETLKKGTARQRATAAERLGERGAVRSTDVMDAIPILVDILKKDLDANARRAAAKALGQIGRETETTVPALVESIKADKSEAVKLASIMALGQIGMEASEALPELRKVAGDKNKKSKIGQAARAALKSIGGKKKG